MYGFLDSSQVFTFGYFFITSEHEKSDQSRPSFFLFSWAYIPATKQSLSSVMQTASLESRLDRRLCFVVLQPQPPTPDSYRKVNGLGAAGGTYEGGRTGSVCWKLT